MKPLTAPFGTDDIASWEKDRDKFSPDKQKVTGPKSSVFLFIPLIPPFCHHLSFIVTSVYFIPYFCFLLGFFCAIKASVLLKQKYIQSCKSLEEFPLKKQISKGFFKEI